MARFVGKLEVESVDDEHWMVMKPFAFIPDKGDTITVPPGFVTDFGSVPRLPVVFSLFGDVAKKATTLHDYLYSKAEIPRVLADYYFLLAMKTINIPAWRRYPMFLGVRIFGANRYGVQEYAD